MTEHPSDRAGFAAMADGTKEDWMKIAAASIGFNRDLPKRVLAHLQLLEGDCGGFAVDRLEHSLQSASLAYRDGMDEEYIVCALMHDIGDTLASASHAELGATIMRPYVSDENWWMMNHHGIFQGYYFFHYLGLDRDMRDQFRGHPTIRTRLIPPTTRCRSPPLCRWSSASWNVRRTPSTCARNRNPRRSSHASLRPQCFAKWRKSVSRVINATS